MNHNVGYVFFACDTKSPAYPILLKGLKELVQKYRLNLITYEYVVKSEKSVLEKVEEMIENAVCIVADIGCDSNRPINSNVAIEVGLTKALKRPLLLISKNPEAVPTNLVGKDILRFPECVTLGNAAFHQMNNFFKNLGVNLLGRRSVKIFESRSSEYLDILLYINSLSGNEWFVSPELRSFLRPPATELRWLTEVRKYSKTIIKAEQLRRQHRRDAFLNNLLQNKCIDIYPSLAFELKEWRKLSLSNKEKKDFLEGVIKTIEDYPSYEIAILTEDQKQKYWIKESGIGDFVIFEGWGYVEVRESKEIGGLIMCDPDTVRSFKIEAEQLIKKSIHKRSDVLDYLKNQIKEGATIK